MSNRPELKLWTDGKDTMNSFEARLSYHSHDGLGTFSFEITGVGDSQQEAIDNLKRIIAECGFLDTLYFFTNYKEFSEDL